MDPSAQPPIAAAGDLFFAKAQALMWAHSSIRGLRLSDRNFGLSYAIRS